jgi:hypothetical protein
MARFVSQYLKFAHGIQSGRPARMGLNGTMIPEVPFIEAQFSHDPVTPKDALVAKSSIKFIAVPEDEAGNEIDPSYRVSVFDSEVAARAFGWSEEEEQLVVDTLRASDSYGSAFVEVLPEPILAPWPNYDNTDPELIISIATQIDADLEQALAYERENQKRPGVIDALTTAVQGEPTEVVRA